MSQKSTAVFKTLSTGTNEWSLGLMRQHVVFVGGRADEGGLAFGTVIGLLLFMDLLVSFKSCLTAELLSAGGALIYGFFRMGFVMVSPGTERAEGFSAV